MNHFSRTKLGVLVFGILNCSTAAHAENRMELGYVRSNLNAGFSSWNDVNLVNYLKTESTDPIILETDYKNHFGKGAGVFGVTYTHTYQPLWYEDFSISASTEPTILPEAVVFTEIHRKLLEDQSLVPGIGLGYIKSDSPYSDVYGLAEVTQYFKFGFSAQIGLRLNQSSPGSVLSARYFGAVNYRASKKFEASLLLEKGKEGYTVVGQNEFINEFESSRENVQLRYWPAEHWGFGSVFEYYENPAYVRDSIGLNLFVLY